MLPLPKLEISSPLQIYKKQNFTFKLRKITNITWAKRRQNDDKTGNSWSGRLRCFIKLFASHYSLVGFVISLKFYVYFSTMDFSSSKFNEESKNHHRPQSENKFPRRYEVISNGVIFPDLCGLLCLKNKVLVYFSVPLLISNTNFRIHQLRWKQKFWNNH